MTFDHVWWADNVAQRMPRVRFGKVHVVNSLYTASGNDSGVGVGVDCNIRVENNVFDDMLIGNYMRATLHGVDALYPDFSPYVAKYGDNGGAKSPSQLQSYFSHYRARDPIGAMMHQLSVKSEQTFRALVPADSRAFRAAKKMFYHFAARG